MWHVRRWRVGFQCFASWDPKMISQVTLSQLVDWRKSPVICFWLLKNKWQIDAQAKCKIFHGWVFTLPSGSSCVQISLTDAWHCCCNHQPKIFASHFDFCMAILVIWGAGKGAKFVVKSLRLSDISNSANWQTHFGSCLALIGGLVSFICLRRCNRENGNCNWNIMWKLQFGNGHQKFSNCMSTGAVSNWCLKVQNTPWLNSNDWISAVKHRLRGRGASTNDKCEITRLKCTGCSTKQSQQDCWAESETLAGKCHTICLPEI